MPALKKIIMLTIAVLGSVGVLALNHWLALDSDVEFYEIFMMVMVIHIYFEQQFKDNEDG